MSNRGCNCTEVQESRAELREAKRAEKYALVLAEHQKKQRIHQAEREVLEKASGLIEAAHEDKTKPQEFEAALLRLAIADANLQSARVS